MEPVGRVGRAREMAWRWGAHHLSAPVPLAASNSPKTVVQTFEFRGVPRICSPSLQCAVASVRGFGTGCQNSPENRYVSCSSAANPTCRKDAGVHPPRDGALDASRQMEPWLAESSRWAKGGERLRSGAFVHRKQICDRNELALSTRQDMEFCGDLIHSLPRATRKICYGWCPLPGGP